MPGPFIVVPRFGFHVAVQQVVSRSGPSLDNNNTYDFNGIVGCGVIVPGSSNGLRVRGVHSFASGDAFPINVRTVICSLAGVPDAILGVINQMPPSVGARYFTNGIGGITGSGDANGILIPDLTTMAINSGIEPAIAAVPLPVPGPVGQPNALNIHMDMCPAPGQPEWDHIYTFDDDPIMIPPNTSVAALFIALRQTDLQAFNPAGVPYPGFSVGGALIGSVLTAPPVDTINGITPARSGNIFVPPSMPATRARV